MSDKPKEKKKKKITKEDAIRTLQMEQDKQIKDCQKEIQVVLDKYNCVLDYRPQITIIPRQTNGRV